MTAQVRVLSARARRPTSGLLVNTTSRSPEPWSRALSPFHLGPVALWGGLSAWNVENAWQYSKVYPDQVGSDGWPIRAWSEWAVAGWGKQEAVRYPRGRGAKPLYSYWEGRALGYIQARKEIYVPLYARAVVQTEAFGHLQRLHASGQELWLLDYDGYDHVSLGLSLAQVLENPARKMGHAFVLAMLLEGQLR